MVFQSSLFIVLTNEIIENEVLTIVGDHELDSGGVPRTHELSVHADEIDVLALHVNLLAQLGLKLERVVLLGPVVLLAAEDAGHVCLGVPEAFLDCLSLLAVAVLQVALGLDLIRADGFELSTCVVQLFGCVADLIAVVDQIVEEVGFVSWLEEVPSRVRNGVQTHFHDLAVVVECDAME